MQREMLANLPNAMCKSLIKSTALCVKGHLFTTEIFRQCLLRSPSMQYIDRDNDACSVVCWLALDRACWSVPHGVYSAGVTSQQVYRSGRHHDGRVSGCPSSPDSSGVCVLGWL